MADGISWENGGLKKITKHDPVIERRYRYLNIGEKDHTTDFQKQISCYKSRDKFMPRMRQVIQYLGKTTIKFFD
jgi:hypothetical protein